MDGRLNGIVVEKKGGGTKNNGKFVLMKKECIAALHTYTLSV